MGLFFDFDKGDIGFSFNDTWGMDEEGNFKMKLSDHTAMDVNTGNISFIAGWDNEEDDDDDDDDDVDDDRMLKRKRGR